MKERDIQPRIVGVIDIGSSAIRMVVIEIQSGGKFRKMDRASKPVQLGRDVFLNHIIGRESIVQAVRILGGFAELFQSWGIDRNDTYVIATSAIREARNRDTFIDRVFVRTGLTIHIVDGVEENHLTYLAVLHAIEDLKAAFSRSASLIMEVGGGSTELMVMDRGKMVAAHLFRLGTLRMERHLTGTTGPDQARPIVDLLLEQFRTTVAGVQAEFNLSRVRYMVMVGGDARIAAVHCGTKKGEHYAVIQRNDFLAFLEKLSKYSAEDCVRNLNLTYYEAESLLPALTVYKIFLLETSAEEIVVPDVSIREGVLLRFAFGADPKTERQHHAQVFASARSLGRKYRFDEAHGLHVAELSMSFFEQFKKEHGLGDREQMYLRVAALLHDIGYFVRATGHHKHGQYIIQNSELFGLSIDELNIVGQLVRYHRSMRPLREHEEYNALSQAQRLVVLKLSAILRVCDALDRSHIQRIKNIELEIKDEDEVIISADYHGDVSLERQALALKGDVFEDVFGYQLVLN